MKKKKKSSGGSRALGGTRRSFALWPLKRVGSLLIKNEER